MSRLSDVRVAVVLALTTTAAFVLGLILDLPCRGLTGLSIFPFDQWCYSDLPVLFTERGLASGLVPYLDEAAGGGPFEYPVVLGAIAYGTAQLALAVAHGASAVWLFVDINHALLLACAIAAVLATAFTVPRRRWDGLMVALAPMAILAGTINWDWVVVALTAAALYAWSRHAPVWSGILLGVGTATKLYPVLILVALVLVSVRSGVWRPTVRLVVAGTVTWLAVNLPVALASFDGWALFYDLGSRRNAEFGSVWLALFLEWGALPSVALMNVLTTATLTILLLGITWLTVAAPRKPRLAQVVFLVAAAFVLTNKVYSPQYVLWLIPLAVLARPRWRDLLIWQAGELVYFAALWHYMPRLLTGEGPPTIGYSLAIAVHAAATGYLACLVVRDVLRPQHDPLRAGTGSDDPGGGPFDGRDRGALGSLAPTPAG